MHTNLISVIVISYNSEDYILETLESIKDQSYKNIELIISDDGSTDDTIRLCTQWINKNKERFSHYEIISNNINTGITANCNRGVMASKGEYIKLIAADDLLLDNCLARLLEFTINNELQIVFSRAIPFNGICEDSSISTIIKDERKSYDLFFNKSNEEQYKALLTMRTPLSMIIGSFYKRELLDDVGMYDETYEMMEDYPFLIKVSEKGYKFILIDEYCVKYRIRLDSKTEEFKKSRRYIAHYNNLRKFRKNEIIPKMREKHMWRERIYISLLLKILHIEYKNNSNIIAFMTQMGRRLKQLLLN